MQVGQRLSVAGVLEVVLEAWVDGAVVCGSPFVDGFGNADERGKVVGGIAVPPGVVCDDGFAFDEE